MILAVDCGNTQTVLGCIDEQGNIANNFRMESNRNKSYFEYASDIEQIFQLLKVDSKAFDGVILSCVVPRLTDTYQKALKIVTGLDAVVVGAGIKTGLRIQIDDPGTIAADLVATAVAAKNEFPLPAIIIDMGTATTVTVVNQEGSYIGGVIMPGVNISLNALARETSLLPSTDITPSKKLIATATSDSMKAGIVYGSAGALDGIISRFEEEIGSAASVIATGGLAKVICPYCKHQIQVEEYLLLKGLWYLWKNNHKS